MENEEELKPEIVSAKISATPNESTWSQAYGAGSLFAILTLNQKSLSEDEEKTSLPSIGKEIFDSLEKEYFTLDEKDLSSIKEAIERTVSHIPPFLISSLIVAAIPTSLQDNILYIFIFGKGKILLKRDDTFGTILNNDSNNIISASGFLKHNDLIILETEKFADLISLNKLISVSDNSQPSEIAETLSPEIHGKEEGDSSAIFIKFLKKENQSEEKVEYAKEIKSIPPSNFFSLFSSLLKKTSLLSPQLNHTKKMFLTIAFIVVIIFILSIFFSIKKQNDTKIKNAFQNVYFPAQQKYDEGQSLLTLNKNLAKEDFLSSKKVLSDALPQFKKDSEEYKKIKNLINKIDEGIKETSGVLNTNIQKVDKQSSKLLSFAIINSTSKSYLYTQDENNIYVISMHDVKMIDKSNLEKAKTIIKNQEDWQSIDGFAVYLGNIYILDKKSNQILKYVNAGNDKFSKSEYFAEDSKHDLSNAVSMTIDGSIWILYKNGAIQKFTKKELQSFKTPTFDKPLTNALHIVTDVDMNNLYILDPINKRVIVIGKDGTFKEQYVNNQLEKAKNLEILEKDKIIYFLADDNVYKITM